MILTLKELTFTIILIGSIGCVDLNNSSSFSDSNERSAGAKTSPSRGINKKEFVTPDKGNIVLSSYSKLDLSKFISDNSQASYFAVVSENMSIILDYDEAANSPVISIMENSSKNPYFIYAYDDGGEIINSVEL